MHARKGLQIAAGRGSAQLLLFWSLSGPQCQSGQAVHPHCPQTTHLPASQAPLHATPKDHGAAYAPVHEATHDALLAAIATVLIPAGVTSRHGRQAHCALLSVHVAPLLPPVHSLLQGRHLFRQRAA